MQWETENEILPGDFAIYSYESVMYCLEEENGRLILDENNDPYFLIDYEDVYIVKRDDTIITINGYILVEPIEVKQDNNFKVLKDDNNSNRFGIVRHIGTRNKRYFGAGKERDDIYDFKGEINIGDVMLF